MVTEEQQPWIGRPFTFFWILKCLCSQVPTFIHEIQLEDSENLHVMAAETGLDIYEGFWMKPPVVAYIVVETVMVSQDLMYYLTFPSLPCSSVGTT